MGFEWKNASILQILQFKISKGCSEYVKVVEGCYRSCAYKLVNNISHYRYIWYLCLIIHMIYDIHMIYTWSNFLLLLRVKTFETEHFKDLFAIYSMSVFFFFVLRVYKPLSCLQNFSKHSLMHQTSPR